MQTTQNGTSTRAPRKTERPHMPGYGLSESEEGLLPWSWAEDKLRNTATFWVATIHPDGRPHMMPVWGLWGRDAFWFGSTLASRKARNLLSDPRCTVTTEDAIDTVVLEGIAERILDDEATEWYTNAANEKYAANYTYDPAINAIFAVRPHRAFGMRAAEDFTGSPTRWQW